MEEQDSEAIRLGVRQRAQEKAVDQSEDGGIHSNAQGQRERHGESEAWVLVQLS